MKVEYQTEETKIKRANVIHHEIEAQIYDKGHPEIFNIYEATKSLKDVILIEKSLIKNDLCIDVGCGTGFLTSFELFRFKYVVSADISRNMLYKIKSKFKSCRHAHLNLIICDAENLPFRDRVADLVSMSSVLHHLPKPFSALMETVRVMNRGGFLYITHELNDIRHRRFFSFFGKQMITTVTEFIAYILRVLRNSRRRKIEKKLNYSEVDIHSDGFNIQSLCNFFNSNHLEVVVAYSYFWVWPTTNKKVIRNILSKINFFIERMPLSKRLGMNICIIGKK